MKIYPVTDPAFCPYGRIVSGLDTAKVKALRVPAEVLVEVYATTLHYAPCHTDAAKGFRVLVALPKGTNTDKPEPMWGLQARTSRFEHCIIQNGGFNP